MNPMIKNPINVAMAIFLNSEKITFYWKEKGAQEREKERKEREYTKNVTKKRKRTRTERGTTVLFLKKREEKEKRKKKNLCSQVLSSEKLIFGYQKQRFSKEERQYFSRHFEFPWFFNKNNKKKKREREKERARKESVKEEAKEEVKRTNKE